MKFRINNSLSHSIPIIIRRCGYSRIFDHQSQQESFVRLLTRNRYPRFHLYVSEEDTEIIFDLHLDQTRSRIAGQTAHRADYESEEVRDELARIYLCVQRYIQ